LDAGTILARKKKAARRPPVLKKKLDESKPGLVQLPERRMRAGILPGTPYPFKYLESAPGVGCSRHESPQSSTAVRESKMRCPRRAQGWLDFVFYFSFVLYPPSVA
jgi:hypothetical protein